MCSDDDESCDVPVNFFLDKELADFWCADYNRQVAEEYADDFEGEENQDYGISYYVETEDIKTTKEVECLFSHRNYVPLKIEVTLS